MIVRVENVHVHYVPTRPVLREVRVQATSGRVTAVVGPNGSGKTTLLRTLAGLIAPSAGTVMMDDRPLDALAATERARRIAYVAHHPRVDAPFTAREVVALGCFAQRRHEDHLHDAMARCEVDDLADEVFQTLSAGQQQRVNLARALAQLGPAPSGRMLIMDEPTAAMDPRHVIGVMDLVRDLAHRDVCVVMSVHDLALACRVADDAWILDDGRIAAAGPVAETMTDDRLTQVFGVAFDWTVLAAGQRVPVASSRSNGERNHENP